MFWAAILMVRRLSDDKLRELSDLVSSLLNGPSDVEESCA